MGILKKKSGRASTSSSAIPADTQYAQIDYYASREEGRLNLELIPLEKIVMDPGNPRTEGIDPAPLVKRMPDFLVIDPEHKDFDQAALDAFDAEMEKGVREVVQRAVDTSAPVDAQILFNGLASFRSNIRRIGVKQPIEVKRISDRPEKYQIIYGHRRYLASLLAGERNIPARVVGAGSKEKLVQTSENLMQESLSLAQALKAFSQTLESLEIPLDSSYRTVGELTGYSKTQVQRYMSILRNSSPELMKAISEGLVQSLKEAHKISCLTKSKQVAAIVNMSNIEVSRASASAAKTASKTTSKKAFGRPRTVITTPRFKESAVVRKIIACMNPSVNLDEIDWDDLNSVQMVWDETIKLLEKD